MSPRTCNIRRRYIFIIRRWRFVEIRPSTRGSDPGRPLNQRSHIPNSHRRSTGPKWSRKPQQIAV